jgi:hypothetical protein
MLCAAGVMWWIVVLLRRRGRFDEVVRLAVPIVIVAAPVVLIGIGAVRFLVAGMLMLAPVAAAAVTAGVDAVHRRQLHGGGWIGRPRAVEYASGKFWTVVLSGLGVVLLPLGVLFGVQGGRPAEIAVIEELPEGCHLFSDAGWAGPVVLVRPDVQVWIDGRADFYGREHIMDSIERFAGASAVPADANCVLAPAQGPFVLPFAANLAESDWARLADRGGYSVWVRR